MSAIQEYVNDKYQNIKIVINSYKIRIRAIEHFDIDWKHFFNSISIEINSVDILSFRGIDKLKYLKRIIIYGCKLPDDLSHINKIENLSSLSFIDCCSNSAIIENFPNVCDIILNDYELRVDCLILKNIPKLRRLSIFLQFSKKGKIFIDKDICDNLEIIECPTNILKIYYFKNIKDLSCQMNYPSDIVYLLRYNLYKISYDNDIRVPFLNYIQRIKHSMKNLKILIIKSKIRNFFNFYLESRNKYGYNRLSYIPIK